MVTRVPGSLSYKLFEMYKDRFPAFQNSFSTLDLPPELSRPFLIDLLDEEHYSSAPVKLMIIGQQTNGWFPEMEDKWVRLDPAEAVENLMNHYRDFDLTVKPQKKKYKKSGKSPFWSDSHRLNQNLNGKEYIRSFISSNLWKMDDWPKGQKKAHPLDATVKGMLIKCFNVLPYEIEILHPDVIVFFTGYSNDGSIREIFQDVEEVQFESLDGLDGKILSRVKHHTLPQNCYRTYHPQYLRRKKMESTLLARLVEMIKPSITVSK